MSLREEEERRKRNTSTSVGVGLATAAIGVGVGAALYYFFNKRLNQPPQEASESARTTLSLLSPEMKQLVETGQMDLATLLEGIKAEHQMSSGSNFALLNTMLSNPAGNYLIEERHDSINTGMETDDEPHHNYLSTIYQAATNHLYGIMHNSPEHEISASEHDGDSSDHDRDSNDHDGDLSDHAGALGDHDYDCSDHDADSSDQYTDHGMDTLSETLDTPDSTHNDTNFDDDNSDDSDSNESDASDSSDGHEDHTIDSERDTTITIDADLASIATVDHYSELDGTDNDEDYIPDENVDDAISNDGAQFHEFTSVESDAELDFLDLDRERRWSLEECSICFDVMLECEQKPVKMLPCGHKFHVGCIDQWLSSHDVCPNCRLPARACS